MQPQEITALAASRGAVVASVSAVAAVRSARNTARALREAEARGIEQSRPIVVAELRKHRNVEGDLIQGMQDLVIKNYGATPARQLRIVFDPPIADPTHAGRPAGSVTSALVRRFSTLTHTLPPGAEKASIYMVGEIGSSGRFENTEPVPDQLVVKIEYEDSAGHWYNDAFALDVNDIGLSTHSRPSRRSS